MASAKTNSLRGSNTLIVDSDLIVGLHFLFLICDGFVQITCLFAFNPSLKRQNQSFVYILSAAGLQFFGDLSLDFLFYDFLLYG